MRILSCLLLLLVFGCSRSGDGDLDLGVNGQPTGGTGFYRIGLLDSGAVAHVSGDSLRIHLDSLFRLSDCAGLHLWGEEERVGDSILQIGFHVELKIPDDPSCAFTGPIYDTVFSYMPALGWNGIREVRLLAQTDSTGERLVPVDTLLVRSGVLHDSLFQFQMDSLFAGYQHLPRTEGSGDVRFLKRLQSATPRSYHLALVPDSCVSPSDLCTWIPDTVLQASVVDGDTIPARIHQTCAEGYSNACSSWVVDSAADTTVVPIQDTARTYLFAFVERQPRCAIVNRYHVLSLDTALLGRSSLWRELLVPEGADTASCSAGIFQDYWAWDLLRDSLVLDSLLLDSLVSEAGLRQE